MPPMSPHLPRLSRTIANPEARDPLPSFRSAELPTSDREQAIRESEPPPPDAEPPKISDFDYYREFPDGSPALDLTVYVAPTADPPDDLVPMMRRTAKLWTRRVVGLSDPGKSHQEFPHAEPGADGWVHLDFVVGYEQTRCGHEACANHHGDHLINPQGQRANGGRNPMVAVVPDFLSSRPGKRITIANDPAKISIGGFRILAHEFGHIFDHQDFTSSYSPHSACNSGAIMCDGWEHDVPAIPTERDFNNIRHHYQVGVASDFEEFGIWAQYPGSADLKGFGVRITRILVVDRAADRWAEAAADFIQDRLVIEVEALGTPSRGPEPGMGTASWNGDLIAVDAARFQPVLGDAGLTMDLSDVDHLRAEFSGLQRTDDYGREHPVAGFAHDLIRKGAVWTNSASSVMAGFYTVDADPAGAVGGTIHDQGLIGAFGALRYQKIDDGPIEIPLAPSGDR